MATLKLTSQLENEVRNKIDMSYKPRSKALLDERNGLLTGEVVMGAYIEQTGGKELYEQCKHWLHKESSKWVRSINNVAINTSIYFMDDNGEGVACPIMSDYLVIPAIETKVQEFKALTDRINDLNVDRSRMTNQIIEAFKSYSSINSAVKANPDLEHLLPEWAKDKMAEKVERAKPIKLTVSVDTAAIKTIAMINRLSGG